MRQNKRKVLDNFQVFQILSSGATPGLLNGLCFIFSEILSPKGHLYHNTDSRVPAILLNGWSLPIGGASAVEGLRSTGLPVSSSSLVDSKVKLF